VLRHPALPAVCRDVAMIAERHFTDADAAMAQCRRRAMRPAAVMGAVYHATLRELLRGAWRDPAARVALSGRLKFWLVLRHGLI
jgi:phytoene/squalene synthetase